MDSLTARQEGTLAEWNDERGFGFIEPAAGGARVFAHIRAWRRGSRRPNLGDVVSFEVEIASDGRRRAVSVYRPFEVRRRAGNSVAGQGNGAVARIIAYGVLAGFVVLWFVVNSYWSVSLWIFLAYAAMSGITFAVYAIDKSAARAGTWRTSERTLHLLGLCGGWPGAVFAQHLLHHKTRKPSFQATFWVTVVLNVVGFVLVNTPRMHGLLSGILPSLADVVG